MTVAVIQFPGSNCETETCYALRGIGVNHELVAWNFNESLSDFSGFILPGGFSFQDRIRAGVIAAKLPILKNIIDESNTHQKPVLGICNGAQILVESGLFSEDGTVSEIIDINYVNNQQIGFMCDWGFLTPFNASENRFLRHLSDGDVLPIQICHGEGRFVMESTPTSGMVYTSINGKVSNVFPTTPNGAANGIGAISNKKGNALAIMPHPERSIDSNRYPLSIKAYAKKNKLNLVNYITLFETFKDDSQ
jgi:phosphoribosylformylglycinamidine synthase subunit PurQ / glutaminase